MPQPSDDLGLAENEDPLEDEAIESSSEAALGEAEGCES